MLQTTRFEGERLRYSCMMTTNFNVLRMDGQEQMVGISNLFINSYILENLICILVTVHIKNSILNSIKHNYTLNLERHSCLWCAISATCMNVPKFIRQTTELRRLESL